MSKNTPAQKKDHSSPEKVSTDSTPFWKKHFLKLFLFLLLAVSIVWGLISNSQLQKQHKIALQELKAEHEEMITDIYKLKNKEVTQTLALAIRSELIDDNKDQVNQYFLQVLKQPSVEKLMLIDHKTGNILISTNKKDEGTKFSNNQLKNASDVTTVMNDGKWLSAAPIMGLSNQLAVIVMVSNAE